MKTFKLLCIALVMVVATPVMAGKVDVRKITIDELQSFIAKKDNLVILDARGGKYFDGKVIKGAGNLPVDTVTEASLAANIPTKDTPVVFYCTNVSCPAGELAARKALDHGYTNVYDYKGGIEGWTAKGLPTDMLN